MSSKMYLLSFTIANCDMHDVEPIAVSTEVDNLKAKAALHIAEQHDGQNEEYVGEWVYRDSSECEWFAPVMCEGEDTQELFYTIDEVDEV